MTSLDAALASSSPPPPRDREKSLRRAGGREVGHQVHTRSSCLATFLPSFLLSLSPFPSLPPPKLSPLSVSLFSTSSSSSIPAVPPPPPMPRLACFPQRRRRTADGRPTDRPTTRRPASIIGRSQLGSYPFQKVHFLIFSAAVAAPPQPPVQNASCTRPPQPPLVGWRRTGRTDGRMDAPGGRASDLPGTE